MHEGILGKINPIIKTRRPQLGFIVDGLFFQNVASPSDRPMFRMNTNGNSKGSSINIGQYSD